MTGRAFSFPFRSRRQTGPGATSAFARIAALALFAVAPFPGAGAHAQDLLGAPGGGDPAAAATASSAPQTISDTQDSGADLRIAQRLRAILGQLPAYANARVAVSQGVVTLTGTVPADSDIGRAADIAGRVAGVVTVDNRLSRDISVASGTSTVTALGEKVQRFIALLPLMGMALAVALVIVMIGHGLARLTSLWRWITPNSFLAGLVASAIRFVFVIGALVIALEMIGATTLLGAVLGGAGVIGVALGFAMRDTVENYVASLMLSLRQPFRPNDHVVIDNYEGRVIRLTSRATILMTLDGNHLRVPNAQVFKAVILNYTRNPPRRFQFDIGIDADDDALAARKLGRDTLASLDFVLAEPRPEGRVIEVGDSNVVLRFLGWVDQEASDWFKAQSLAIVAVKTALETGGFGMPEPIYRLRFDQRTGPLPLERMRDGKQAVVATAPASAAPPAEDMRPVDEVKGMIEAERAQDAGDEADLLDHARPVE